jgi:transposase InsO family protein
VAAVLDLFSRRVVGWSMSAAMTAELVTDALVMAIWRRGRPRELLRFACWALFQLLWLQVNALTHLTSAGRMASPETVSVWLCSY